MNLLHSSHLSTRRAVIRQGRIHGAFWAIGTPPFSSLVSAITTCPTALPRHFPARVRYNAEVVVARAQQEVCARSCWSETIFLFYRRLVDGCSDAWGQISNSAQSALFSERTRGHSTRCSTAECSSVHGCSVSHYCTVSCALEFGYLEEN